MALIRDEALRTEIRAALAIHPPAELRAAAARAGVVNRRGQPFGEWYADDPALARALVDGDAELPFMGLPLLAALDPPRALVLAREALARDNEDMLQAGAAWVLPDDELLARIEAALPEARAMFAETPPRAPVLDLFHLIKELGRRGCRAAIPLLVEQWREGFQGAAAGHALLAIGTPEALAALADRVAERPPVLAVAVRALFARDPAGAFDRLAPLLAEAALADPLRRGQARQILSLLWTDANPEVRASSPRQGWLRADPRWLDLVLGIATGKHAWRDPAFVDLARSITAGFPRAAVEARTPRTPRPGKRAGGKLVEAARTRMAALAPALAMLVDRLREVGHELRHAPIVAVAPAALAALEARVAVPASLRAFWQLVGTVDLTGQHPELAPGGELATDPLVVLGPEVALQELDDWEGEQEAIVRELRPVFPIPISPEALVKNGYSGGPPYTVRATGAADEVVDGIPRPTRFAAYVEDAIRKWAGFPGFAALRPRPTRLLRRLTAELP